MEDNNNNKKGINDPELQSFYTNSRICPNCKQKIETNKEICPLCGHYLYEKEVRYEPLPIKTTKKIKLILGVVLIGVFLILVATGAVELKACSQSENILKTIKYI